MGPRRALVVSAARTASAAMPATVTAFWVISAMEAPIWSAPEATVSIPALTSRAAAVTSAVSSWAPSAVRVIPSLLWTSRAAVSSSRPTAVVTSLRTEADRSKVSLSAAVSASSSVRPRPASRRVVTSPLRSTCVASRIGRTMLRPTTRASAATSRMIASAPPASTRESDSATAWTSST